MLPSRSATASTAATTWLGLRVLLMTAPTRRGARRFRHRPDSRVVRARKRPAPTLEPWSSPVRVAVTGSIATDHLMTFPGRYSEVILPDQLANISISVLVDDLVVRRGGVGANIAFGMGVLGLQPLLVGAVGSDFAEYRAWLDRHGVDTSKVHVSEVAQTARFVCTTDADQNQIASFYPGAMSEAREIELGPIAAKVGGIDLVIVGPNDPDAMLRHTQECRDSGIPFVADPSQQLASMDGDVIRPLIDGAAYLFTNEYEAALTEQKTGWSSDEILDRVGTRV